MRDLHTTETTGHERFPSSHNKLFSFCFNIQFFVDALGKHPLCHRMCKVTKETSGANKIRRNAIDSTSITFRWTSSSSRQSVFSTTTIAKKTEENGSQLRKSDYLVIRTFARIKTVIWDQLLATKAEIIQS